MLPLLPLLNRPLLPLLPLRHSWLPLLPLSHPLLPLLPLPSHTRHHGRLCRLCHLQKLLVEPTKVPILVHLTLTKLPMVVLI
jgi:hypothetical protein